MTGAIHAEQRFSASPDLPPAVPLWGQAHGGMLEEQRRGLGHHANTGTSLAASLSAQLGIGDILEKVSLWWLFFWQRTGYQGSVEGPTACFGFWDL